MFKKFISYYKPFKKELILDLMASLISSMLSICYPIITRLMLNDFIPNKKYNMIVYAGLGVLFIYIVRLALRYYVSYAGHMMGVRMQVNMRKDLFNHFQQLPYTYYDNNETGYLMSRFTTDLADVTELAHHAPENVVISVISIIVAVGYLCTINVPLTLIILIILPIMMLINGFFRRKQKLAYTQTKIENAKINAELQTALAGIRVTKAFNNANKEKAKLDFNLKDYALAYKDTYHYMGLFNGLSTFVTEVFNVVILICGGLFLYAGKINFADYSAFVVSISMFIRPIDAIIGFMERFREGAAGFERFCTIMDEPVEQDKENAKPLENVKGIIEFKNVSSAYATTDEILHDVSFKINKGETFALVGPSGGGKSTICHLLPHFYDRSSGEILIDGHPIDEITLKSLRDNIGIVQQDTYLFNASIYENILYGNPNASKEEVLNAARLANIDEFVNTLPNGYDTLIGERGVRLSGGQKQRLCIARVFVKNPPILILDEATSALDNATEILIQNALDELSKGRTTIVVAHRLSTIRNANNIAVVDNGRIQQLGSHDELMKQDGLYKDLYSLQFERANHNG